MTWTKLSDDFSDDCWLLTDAAWRLHVEGLLWSNRKLLDLVLSKDEMRLWAKRPETARELVEIGWWVDNGDSYTIVHHGRYQRSREAVLHQQDANRRNGMRGGRKPRPTREQVAEVHPTETESLCESLCESSTERDGTGQDRPGQEKSTGRTLRRNSSSTNFPAWRGTGPDPYSEYR
ncbi:MAG: hypothetical protein WCI78_16795 [Mycobacterium sp.]